MEIKGFIETSLIDWDGKIVSVVFLPGCNFRCPFCHNHILVKHPEQIADVPWERIESFLKGKKGWIDGVVITGGEPTIHKDLMPLLMKLKGLGLPAKLDTNGSNPALLRKIIDQGLVEFIAMDIKASFDQKYDLACGVVVNKENIRESIGLILSSGLEYEFRTTIVPQYHDLDSVDNMAREIKGAKKWVLQQFVQTNADNQELRNMPPYNEEYLEEMRKTAEGLVERVVLRGI
ncbi:MAG: anaerobic ribonucleoside-triphosphate reductase activating protein [Candidatus Edwardsbacteria bacterium]|nr:anaerobic ribonucleoside-triphosphate reductase activating protein [Candidatus Edwardsbacteria bacterium]MBU2463364.1 anaerobic ribonucleoside-triphosphate reductase activating protein [Candidatus Edwardsbacteria bacterium]MBU2594561.1 anaerobic ribonucleoside-triphosphate reductase activating protein [Candidatus Edwardsbacteria bacterium]